MGRDPGAAKLSPYQQNNKKVNNIIKASVINFYNPNLNKKSRQEAHRGINSMQQDYSSNTFSNERTNNLACNNGASLSVYNQNSALPQANANINSNAAIGTLPN